MLIECATCESRVDAKEVGQYDTSDEETNSRGRMVFLQCSSCSGPLVAYQDTDEEGWSKPRRVYPSEREVSPVVPAEIRKSFQEAQRCLQAKCFLAAALMCRRTLETVCRHYVPARTLAEGLRKLEEKDIIDKTLLKWADALREDGNLAAHGVDANFSREDASDVVDFTEAILDYVFVLHDRFEQYQARRAVKRSGRTDGKPLRT